MTIAYPDDDEGGGGKRTFAVGDRVDVQAGRMHEVWMGEGEGCEYVVGEMG